MTPREILAELAKDFPLKVRSEHHVQIDLGGGFHDFWIAEHGRVLKIRYHGQRRIEHCRSVAEIARRLRSYRFENTDLADLKQLERLIGFATRKPGIWVDAGWKNGRAKLAVIHSRADGFDITVRHFPAGSHIFAERQAIELACSLYPGAEPIFTDCQTLAGGRVQWIPREQNGAADKLSNLRGTG